MRRDEQLAVAHLARQLSRKHDNKNHLGGWSGWLGKTGQDGIPAREESTAGWAEVNLCMIANDGAITETATKLRVYNPFSTPISSNTFITIKVINGTQLVVDAEDCQ